MIKKILYPIIALLLSSCFLNPSSSEENSADYLSRDTYKIESDTPIHTFLLLTNDSILNKSIPSVSVNGVSRSLAEKSITSDNEHNLNYKRKLHFHPISSIGRGNSRSITAPVTDQYGDKIIGDIQNFYIIENEILGSYKAQNFKLVDKTNIAGDLDLYIWADNEKPTGITHYNHTADITDAQIAHIRDSFTEGVTDSGIYHDMKSIFGEHWGDSSNNSDLLSPDNRDIHILLTDIKGDLNAEETGYIAGYFKSSDTERDSRSLAEPNYSNQALTLVIDSFNYLNPKKYDDYGNESPASWSSTSYETADLISTIIHEYQHLINFYQKGVKQDYGYEFFFNEMLSMAAEDILANKYMIIKTEDGEFTMSPHINRVPDFNLFWDENSSFFWDNNSLNSYSMSYVLGAYLLRNYGISFFKKYLESDGVGIETALQALNSINPNTSHSKKSLLENFGSAVLSSNIRIEEAPLRFYNTDYFNIDGYKVVPINFFNPNYRYYYLGYEENRLFNGTSSLTRGHNRAPFNPMSLDDIEKIRGSRKFLKESNIYIYLGKLDRNAEIIIDHYDSSTYSRIIY